MREPSGVTTVCNSSDVPTIQLARGSFPVPEKATSTHSIGEGSEIDLAIANRSIQKALATTQ